MQRSIFIGLLFLTMATLHANQDSLVKKDSLSSAKEKELINDLSQENMIANEAVEAPDNEKDDLVAVEIEESDLDIDTLILEAENALKEELIDDSGTLSAQKRVILQYDNEDNARIFTDKNQAASKDSSQNESSQKPQTTMEFAEIPMDALSQTPALFQEPVVEFNEKTSISSEEAPKFSTPEARVLAPSSYEIKDVEVSIEKQDLPTTSSNSLIVTEDTAVAPALQETNVSSSEVSLEKQTSISSIPVEQTIAQDKPLQPVFKNSTPKSSIDLQEVFSGSPVIYTLLLFLSIATIALFFYHYLYLRITDLVPAKAIQNLQTKISQQQYLEAKAYCLLQDSFFFKMVASGISVKEQALPEIVEVMKTEGKKYTMSYWHKLGLLNDIAIVAPMVGLLGTVLGMFYAFYDINQSSNTLSSLFDGLGVSVGTTVAGLIVAIMSMIFHSLSKYRLMKILSFAETQSEQFAHLIKASTMQGDSVQGGHDEADSR